MKYRHCDGKLELKVTNDQVVRTLPQWRLAAARSEEPSHVSLEADDQHPCAIRSASNF